MPLAATWMELEMIIPTEVKSERGRQIPYDITYIGSLNMTQMNITAKQK